MSGKVTPIGISQLTSLDSVCVRQKGHGFSGNKYLLTDRHGQPLLRAKEKGGMGILGGKDRSFNIVITDTQDNQVIALRRPYTFGPDKMEVAVCGQLASVVRQEVTFLKAVLNINDPQDRLVLRIKGPAITTVECDFEIFSPNKQRVGVIRKMWGGAARELLTNNDSFRISFPVNLDVRYKAAIIGTCFLIVYGQGKQF